MRILLVDDSASIRTMTKGFLTPLGYTDFAEAENGKVAMAKAGEASPGLVFTDWNMPEMNGIDFVRAFRAAGHKCPVIMMTTEKDKTKVVEAVKAGVNNYVLKPFKKEEFYKHLGETLKKAGLALPEALKAAA